MNWFRILKFALSGEFWITDDYLLSADDFSDTNHEGHAMQTALSHFLDHFNIYEEFFDPSVIEEKASIEIIDNMSDQEIYTYLKEYGIDDKNIKKIIKNKNLVFDFVDHGDVLSNYLDDNTELQELYSIAMGRGDARLYGMKELGWKRLEGNNVETFHISRSDMDQIANGLHEAYGEESENSSFNIHVHSTKKYYTNIPYYVISSKNIGLLRNYMEKF